MDAAFLNGEQGETSKTSLTPVALSRRRIATSPKSETRRTTCASGSHHPAYDASAVRDARTRDVPHARQLPGDARDGGLDVQTTRAFLPTCAMRARFARARRAVRVVADVAPRWTRVKELVESVEAFRNALAFLAEAETKGERAVDTFFDMACGHGLVGVLIAYAFPEKTVRACDWTRRPAFEAYARVFGAFASLEQRGGRFDYDTWARGRRSKSVAEDAGSRSAARLAESDLSDVNVTTKRENGDAEIAAGLLRALDGTLPDETLGSVVPRRRWRVEPLVASTSSCWRPRVQGEHATRWHWRSEKARCGAMPCCVVKDLYALECVLSNRTTPPGRVSVRRLGCRRRVAREPVDKRITNRR